MSKTVSTAPAKPAQTAPATKDAGRVHVGGGMMRYAASAPTKATTHDAGRVHVGGGMMRF